MNRIKNIMRNNIPSKIWLQLIKFKQNVNNKKKQINNKKIIKQTYIHYKTIEQNIHNRENKVLRFGAYVVYDASFSAYGLMDLMLADSNSYSAKIVIIPDVARGQHNLVQQYKETKDFFIKLYGQENVLDGYDIEKNTYYDLSDQFDIINLANPYDHMVHKFHGVKYLSTRNVLPIYISYGCMPDKYGSNEIIPMFEISLFWKVFADNKISYKDYKKYELAKGKNVRCTGYLKMDSLAKVEKNKPKKTTIILAPHHTVNNPALPLSNFLDYYDYILELPQKYLDIQFIFRPHPLLFINLINNKIWSSDEVQKYKDKLQENNIIYSYGGNYFDIFVNSDGIIHDCSSFIVEYLYTDKPCCFVANNKTKSILSELGKKCLRNYYIAYSKEQINEFIEKVIINQNDKLKTKRLKFTDKYIKYNYPNVSKIILNEISL